MPEHGRQLHAAGSVLRSEPAPSFLQRVAAIRQKIEAEGYGEASVLPLDHAACLVCRRPLKKDLSAAAGIGRSCRRAHKLMPDLYGEAHGCLFDLPWNPRLFSYFRTPGDVKGDQPLRFSFPRLAPVYPGPLGWGKPGEAGKEFALQILACACRADPDQIHLDHLRISRTAWNLHEQFASDVVSRLYWAGGVITAGEVYRYIDINAEPPLFQAPYYSRPRAFLPHGTQPVDPRKASIQAS